MDEWRRSRFSNPAAWFAVAGTCLLAFSLALPWLSASRTARIEERADGIAAALLAAAAGFEAPLEEWQKQAVLARFFMAAACWGERVKDVVRVNDDQGGNDQGSNGSQVTLRLSSKHYAFQLSASKPQPTPRPGPDTVPAWEVVAWPLGTVGPGHTTFFYPENACRAQSRNLGSKYAGFADDASPKPGSGQRRAGLAGRRGWRYPGNDNGLWTIY